jgi:tritrans,polycis-undecaprenyl-diphosphate synthase [geranylgeranyl-diphosphate specific]
MMRREGLPKTVALIPDGNRRWVRKHGLSISSGYNIGVKNFIAFSKWCTEMGIYNLTVWALSSDNLKRSRLEVRILFNIFKKIATDNSIREMLHENKTRLKVIGDTSLLPKDLLAALHALELETEAYTGSVINMLMGYGGRDDVIFAARNYAKSGSKEPFDRYLMSNTVPDLDLIIRTSGEQRLSGFMPWQSSYSELYFSKKLWPEFTKADLQRALKDYSGRQRRFGK